MIKRIFFVLVYAIMLLPSIAWLVICVFVILPIVSPVWIFSPEKAINIFDFIWEEMIPYPFDIPYKIIEEEQ